MSRLATLVAVVAGAIAGGVVALVVSDGGSTTKTITTVASSTPTSSNGSSIPTSYSSGQNTQPISINQIYQKDSPGVVDIIVTTESSSSGSSGFPNFFGGGGGGGGQTESQDEGAGVVYNSTGDIITDEHVIAGAVKVQVNFWNGKSYPAKVLGSDASTDVGVIKVEGAPASELHPIAFADSDNAKVGDPVVAIGSPFSLPETVTSGIVSQVGRSITAPNNYTITGAIQTDAAINPGNSGGPLLDADGEVLGLNDQIETNSDQNAGVGFATPGNTDQIIANKIIAGKKVEHSYVGVELNGALTDTNGAQIQQVEPNSPASKAGLTAGDVVTAIDGKSVDSTEAFITDVGAYAPGQTVTLTVKHAGTTKQVKLTLGTRPASAPTG